MADRSLQMYEAYRSGVSQYDYFITGLAAAVFAYVGEKYVPRLLDLSPNSLEPFALGALLIAVFAGLKRIETGVEADRHNFSVLDAGEKRRTTWEALHKGRPLMMSSGPIQDPETLHLVVDKLTEKQSQAQDRLDVYRARGKIYYHIRDQALFAGMTLLLIQKIAAPYWTGT